MQKFKRLLALMLSLCLIILVCGCKDKQNNERKKSTGQYKLISSFYPGEDDSAYESGVLIVGVVANGEITGTASFNGETLELSRQQYNEGEGGETDYIYATNFNLPNVKRNAQFGQICFSVTDGNTTETYYSGIITVNAAKSNANGKEITPNYMPYMNVGTGMIAEVTGTYAETLDGDTIDDYSRPTNNYLPKGTVDYCANSEIANPVTEKNYRLLRCGRRINTFDLSVYEGELPKFNAVSLGVNKTDSKYAYLSFYTDWKAPFFFDIKEQEYLNPVVQNYKISEVTYSYVEITFCYCPDYIDKIEFASDHPLFSKSEIINRENDTVVRLYLKEVGAFYGWKAYYDEDDSLVFKFLIPTKLYPADNKYGAAIYDATIVVDAGHGGSDPGAVRGNEREAAYNLMLAKAVRDELKAVGANVIMTREVDSSTTAGDRLRTVYACEPDLIISIHRNAGGGNGFGTYYFSPYSYNMAKSILQSTASTDLYRTQHFLWHYFFLNRVSFCPAVLTENGFMSDTKDFDNMENKEHTQRCAEAIVRGIIESYKMK